MGIEDAAISDGQEATLLALVEGKVNALTEVATLTTAVDNLDAANLTDVNDLKQTIEDAAISDGQEATLLALVEGKVNALTEVETLTTAVDNLDAANLTDVNDL